MISGAVILLRSSLGTNLAAGYCPIDTILALETNADSSSTGLTYELSYTRSIDALGGLCFNPQL